MTRKYPNIFAECARRNLLQTDLACSLGVSTKTLNNWQAGRTEIPASALMKMALMWNVSTDYILGMEKPESA